MTASDRAQPDAPELAAPSLFDRAPAPSPTADTGHVAPERPRSADPEEPADAAALLGPDTRRALVLLLRHGVVLARNRNVGYAALLRERAAVERHLANMFLSLLVDESRGVMLLRQNEAGEPGEEGADEDAATSLLNLRTLPLYQTLVVLVLRKLYQEREAAGEQRVFVDTERVAASLTPFLPLTQSSTLDRKKLNGALDRLREHRLLLKHRGEDERFEISPVIRYVVSAEVLEDLLGRYGALAEQQGIVVPDANAAPS